MIDPPTPSASPSPGSAARPVPVVAVVLPAYRSAAQVSDVLARVPAFVAHLVLVDDASPDELARVLAGVDDRRLLVLTHPVNRGVGAAMKTGFGAALELGAEVIVKLDSDGQMDPERIADLIAPILAGEADFTKGNRFHDLRLVRQMPLVRRLGNLGLSFLVKLAAGYWRVFDPCNGFLALRRDTLRALDRARLAERYFFEISLLCEAYLVRAVVCDVPMPPVYGREISSLSPLRSLFGFLPRLLSRAARRIGYAYFLRDFNLVSVFLAAGAPLLSFGVLWSAFHWRRSIESGVVATTGTVIIGALTILLGFQLLLQALVLDVQNEPGRRPR